MVERGWIKNPAQYEMVMETGNLDYADEADIKKLYQMRSENEVMMSGGKPIAIVTDNHKQHIFEHEAVLASPEARKDAVIVESTITHIQEHIDILSNPQYAMILQMLGQEPLAPNGPQVPNKPPAQPTRPGTGKLPPPPAANIAPAGMATDMAAKTNMPTMPNNPLSGRKFNNEDGGL